MSLGSQNNCTIPVSLVRPVIHAGVSEIANRDQQHDHRNPAHLTDHDHHHEQRTKDESRCHGRTGSILSVAEAAAPRVVPSNMRFPYEIRYR
jgi:hypothetical protein